LLLQSVKEERELTLLKSSFSSDLQVFQELDAIAGTSGAETFSLKVVLQFLKSKSWEIKELKSVEDIDLPASQRLPPSVPPAGPKSHFYFESSSDNGEGSAPVSVTEEVVKPAKNNDDDDDVHQSTGNPRSVYVGHGNIQDVTATMKDAGLSDCFPKSEPLLVEFGSFLRAGRAAEKDTANKASQISKLLKYLSSLQTDVGAAAYSRGEAAHQHL